MARVRGAANVGARRGAGNVGRGRAGRGAETVGRGGARRSARNARGGSSNIEDGQGLDQGITWGTRRGRGSTYAAPEVEHEMGEDHRLEDFENLEVDTGNMFGTENPPTVYRESDNTKDLLKFTRLFPNKFKGTETAEQAENWISEAESTLEAMDVDSDYARIKFTAFQLTEQAKHWWNGVKRTHDVKSMSWNEFKEVYLKNYFPRTTRDKRRMEFLTLTQNGSSVLQYERQFTSLAVHASDYLPNEEEKTRKFIAGLDEWIRKVMAGVRRTNYAEAVDSAMDIEHAWERRKPNQDTNSQFNNKRFRDGQMVHAGSTSLGGQSYSASVESQPKFFGKCNSCGIEGHKSIDCRKSNNQCFKCGSPDHRIKMCPANVSGNSMMYQPTQSYQQSSQSGGQSFIGGRSGNQGSRGGYVGNNNGHGNNLVGGNSGAPSRTSQARVFALPGTRNITENPAVQVCAGHPDVAKEV